MKKSMIALILLSHLVFATNSPAVVLLEMSAGDYIRNAQGLTTDRERAEYLLLVGELLIQEKRFTDARQIAEYLLKITDDGPIKAKTILMATKVKEDDHE